MTADQIPHNRHRSMDAEPAAMEELLTKTGHYIESKIELTKYKIVDKSSGIFSSLLKWIVIGFVSVIFLSFLNIGLALYLGEVTGEIYYGFFIVGGFYMLMAIVIMLFGKKVIVDPVRDFIINRILN